MIAWFARNGVAANLLLLVILAIGGWSLKERIPLEVFPSFERDVINVAIPYQGASPSEVEKAVVIRAEEAIADLEGIKGINSSAYEGAARIAIEVEDGFKPRELINDVKSSIDSINTFPSEVESAGYSVSIFRREVISVAISGALTELDLRRVSEQIRDELAALPEISYAELSGIREYEIGIEITPQKLEQIGLTLGDVVSRIRQSSIDVPAGSIKSDSGEILLRSAHTAETIETFGNIALLSKTDGVQLKLKDIATLSDGFAETPVNTQFNGESAIIIEVYRTGKQSAIKVANAVKAYVELKQQKAPSGLKISLWRDRSKIVKLRLQTLMKSAWQGGLLVFICLALFLRLSVALWVCVGIPIAFMGALILMPILGVTLNIISLFAFILVLGVVVDDAIITGENVYSHLKKSKNSLQAAINGTQEVAVPVTFGMLTTVAAFLPLLFIEGVRGQIFSQIALIVIPVLAFSWVESKLILPSHLTHVKPYIKEKSNVLLRAQQGVAAGLEWVIERCYQPVLKFTLKQRYLTFAVFIGFSFLVATYVISGRFGFAFFPRVDSETARATLTMQAGTHVNTTSIEIRKIEAAALELQAKYTDDTTKESVIKNVLTSVGWKASGGRASPTGGDSEIGQVSLELTAPEVRTLDIGTRQLVEEWREAVGVISTAKELSYRAEIGRGGDPIAVALLGNDTQAIKELSTLVKQRLAQYPSLFDIQDSLADGKTQLQITLKESAQFLNIDAKQLGEQLRHAFYGLEAQRLQRGRDDVRVVVRFPEIDRNSQSTLEHMQVRTANGVLLPISSIADFTFEQGASTIKREDRQRRVTVSADANKKEINASNIAQDLTTYLDSIIGQYPSISYELAGELKEQGESFGSLQYGILLALFAIYSLLAIPLKSYTQPLIVMLVIPFSTIGAILGHSILGMTLSMMSILGMLALAGVAVNDSLVLVHWINKKRNEGLSTLDAARTAGAARFRPILLTSLTTFFGLSPLLLEKSTQAQFLIPMAVSLGFGILYATLLSLILIPSAYVILDDFKRAFRWLYPKAA
jgi:multidrug efflux pump subunit AcrB